MRLSTLVRTLFNFIDTSYSIRSWEKKNTDDAIGYLELVHDTSNDFLWKRFSQSELKNVLELGCNSGSRIFSGAIKFSNTHFYGVDINQSAVNVAKEYAATQRITNTNFISHDIRNIEKLFKLLEIEKFDLIFTWATLIYIHPKYIGNLLQKVMEKGTKIILIEQHDESLNKSYKGKLTSSGRNYLRNYTKILSKIGFSKENIKVTDVPNEVWAPGGGFASLIEINCK